MQVTIDPGSGFCFGVVHAIEVAEQELREGGVLYCLGEIVHNPEEVKRLGAMGLRVISHDEFARLSDCRVMIRAHGEPPETYRTARRNNITLLDASCRVVLKLQQEVNRSWTEMKAKNGQVVLYGKPGHAEIAGLAGQTGGEAIVVSGPGDLDRIDFTRPVRLFSQTTMSPEGLAGIADAIRGQMEVSAGKSADFEWRDTVCRQVSNRSGHLRDFAGRHDVIIFVSGRNSSNGKVLYQVCREANPATYLVSDPGELDRAWFEGMQTAGVCGATSTPLWLMEETARKIMEMAG